MGKITASLSDSLAASKPATSSHLTLGFSVKMALSREPRSLLFSEFSSSSSFFVSSPSALTFFLLLFGWSRISFSFSALFMYSSVFALTDSLSFGFFSYLSAMTKCFSDL
eukprot:Lithocolla_globosa_v1_NODE_4800_length_1361_cov_23.837796.p3 type:complete len:110 gc:universal NODE_4800_length_1361_cov_23.837796:877-1206(+)